MSKPRIISIVHRPHLATFEVSEKTHNITCTLCEYEIFIEDEDGVVFVYSEMEKTNMCGCTAEEYLRDIGKGITCNPYPWNEVEESDFMAWMKGEAENGYSPLEAIEIIVKVVRAAGMRFEEKIEQQLTIIADLIKK